MNKFMKGIAAGLAVSAMFSGAMAIAKTSSEQIEAIYNNIKIFINNQQIDPTDANGNAVEPFIYNGTTYLPVRAVSEALGKDVKWDGENQSVYISDKDTSICDNICGFYVNTEFLDDVRMTKSVVDSQKNVVALLVTKDEITGDYMLMQGDAHQGGANIAMINHTEDNGLHSFNFTPSSDGVPTTLTYDIATKNFNYSARYFMMEDVINHTMVKFDDGRDYCEYIAYTLLSNSPDVITEDEKIYIELDGRKLLVSIAGDATEVDSTKAKGYVSLIGSEDDYKKPYCYYNIDGDNFVILDENCDKVITTIKL